jgi:glycerophosphoryl diester phosphodiesterase
VNSFDGRLLSYIDKKYKGRYRLHGFYPFEILGSTYKKPSEMLYCACLFYQEYTDGKWQHYSDPICPRDWFSKVHADGIHPWIGAGAVTEEQFIRGTEYGGELFTSNHPERAMEILKRLGYR